MPRLPHRVMTWVIPVLRARNEVHDPEQVGRDLLLPQVREPVRRAWRTTNVLLS